MKLQKSLMHPNTFAVVVEDDDENLLVNTLERTGPNHQEFDDVELDDEPLMPPPLFEGAGDTVAGGNNDENAPLVAPKLNFEKQKKEQGAVNNTDEETPLTIPVMDVAKKKK